MGLGLFIAKTLLERTGAELTFMNAPANAGDRSGALVSVHWPAAVRLPLEQGQRPASAKNLPITG